MRLTISGRNNMMYNALAALVFTVGAIASLGWIGGSVPLITWYPGYAPLQPTGALCFMLLGLGMLYPRVRVIMALIVSIAVLGQVLEYIHPLGVSSWLLYPWYTAHTTVPGVIGLEFAAGLLISAQLLFYSIIKSSPIKVICTLCALTGALVMLLGVITFFYTTLELPDIHQHTLISVPAVTGLILVALAHMALIKKMLHGH